MFAISPLYKFIGSGFFICLKFRRADKALAVIRHKCRMTLRLYDLRKMYDKKTDLLSQYQLRRDHFLSLKG